MAIKAISRHLYLFTCRGINTLIVRHRRCLRHSATLSRHDALFPTCMHRVSRSIDYRLQHRHGDNECRTFHRRLRHMQWISRRWLAPLRFHYFWYSYDVSHHGLWMIRRQLMILRVRLSGLCHLIALISWALLYAFAHSIFKKYRYFTALLCHASYYFDFYHDTLLMPFSDMPRFLFHFCKRRDIAALLDLKLSIIWLESLACPLPLHLYALISSCDTYKLIFIFIFIVRLAHLPPYFERAAIGYLVIFRMHSSCHLLLTWIVEDHNSILDAYFICPVEEAIDDYFLSLTWSITPCLDYTRFAGRIIAHRIIRR